MSNIDPPPWLTEGLENPIPGELVNPAVLKARSSNNAKDVAELCIGNLFAVFLVLLAPLFKIFIDSNSSKNHT